MRLSNVCWLVVARARRPGIILRPDRVRFYIAQSHTSSVHLKVFPTVFQRPSLSNVPLSRVGETAARRYFMIFFPILYNFRHNWKPIFINLIFIFILY
jgi:hypothetical protein